MSCRVVSCRVASRLVLSCGFLVLRCLALPCLALSCLDLPCLAALTCFALSCLSWLMNVLLLSYLVLSCLHGFWFIMMVNSIVKCNCLCHWLVCWSSAEQEAQQRGREGSMFIFSSVDFELGSTIVLKICWHAKNRTIRCWKFGRPRKLNTRDCWADTRKILKVCLCLILPCGVRVRASHFVLSYGYLALSCGCLAVVVWLRYLVVSCRVLSWLGLSWLVSVWSCFVLRLSCGNRVLFCFVLSCHYVFLSCLALSCSVALVVVPYLCLLCLAWPCFSLVSIL